LPLNPAQARGFAVHILTASGAALGLLALIAAAQGAWATMFIWLGAAIIVDGVDGALARRAQVAALLPRWSGDVLDLVVDFVNYVFVPAFAIAVSGLLPPLVGTLVALAVTVSGAIYFADNNMKLPGNYFRGFPGLWNLATFYLFLLKPEPWLGAAALLVLVGLTFAPFRFIHPTRVRRWRNLNVGLLAAWAALALLAVLRDLAPGAWIVTGLCVIGLYFFGFGLLVPRERTDTNDA